MSFGYENIGDVVILKFDMHVYTSDEVKNLIAKYAIPLDLYPCVPPSGLTMNRLPADKIGIYDQYLELSGDSSVVDAAPTGVHAEDILRLFENVMDLRPVHPTMLYAIDLTTIWKHVGAPLGVRVGKETALAVNEVIPKHTTPPLPLGSHILEKSDHQRVVEYKNERRTKKKKTAPLSFALLDSKEDGFGTYYFASPLNTIIPNEAGLTTGGGSVILVFVNREEEEDAHDIRDETAHIYASGSIGRVSSSSGGSNRQAFPRHNPGGLTDGEFLGCRLTETQNQLLDDIHSQKLLSKDHQALQQVHLGCVGKEAGLTEKLAAMEKERDDLLDKDREREEYIKQLEADLTNKTSSLSKTEGVVNTLKGYVEGLTGVKAAYSEEETEAFLATTIDYDPACKDNFMTEFDFLFNKSYLYVKKLVKSFWIPLGDLQNMWAEGTGPTLSGTYYVLGKVRRLAIGSWTHPRRPALWIRCVTWPLALGLIQNVLRSGVRRSMFRHSSSSFSSSLVIMVRCVGISIFAGITTSLSYVRLNGVSMLLCFREVRWAEMLGRSPVGDPPSCSSA
uniref:Transposase (Putative), gypsy type n=1 Tax=Tanacetum cinerariifolium TaxID=118510 RepID=A0A6L2LE79_TANCI|nr:hypothetical protein [Tanacetum cinerariifolium]